MSLETLPLELREHFGRAGFELRYVTIHRDSGRPTGSGMVDLGSADAAARAVSDLSGTWLNGSRIDVQLMEGAKAAPARRDNDGRQVFFGALSREVDEEALASFCESVGGVARATIFFDRESGRHRGCGRVEFDSAELANRAIRELDGAELCGRPVTVELMGQDSGRRPLRTFDSRQAPDRQVFCGGISHDTDNEALRAFGAQIGIVTYASVFMDRESGRPKGAGKLEFETAEVAQQAIRELNGQMLDGRTVTVRLMGQPGERVPQGSPKQRENDGRLVYFGRLSFNTDDEALRTFCLERIGGVTYAGVFIDRETGKSKGSGKVEFETVELAQRAIQELDGQGLDGRTLVVQLIGDEPRAPRQPREPSLYDQAEPACKLFIGSLPPDVSDDRLSELLSQAGTVRYAVAFTTSVGTAGRAVMSSSQEAQRAIAVLNDTYFGDKRIVVKLDLPPGERAKPSVEAMIYVGGLSLNTTADDLRGHFASAGDVLHATVFTDRETGRPRGSGKVEFSSAAAAQRAISDLHDTEIDGRQIVVKLMEPRGERTEGPRPPDGRQVFVGALGDADAESLRRFCEEKIGSVTFATVFRDRETGESKGAGKVEFQTTDLADSAIRELDGAEFNGKTLAVRRMGDERPPRTPNEGQRGRQEPDGRSVFVGGLAWEVGSDDLKVFASQCGEVCFAQIFIDKETGKSKGAGKVQFATEEIANQAAEELNGLQLLGREVTSRLMA